MVAPSMSVCVTTLLVMIQIRTDVQLELIAWPFSYWRLVFDRHQIADAKSLLIFGELVMHSFVVTVHRA